MSQTLQPFFFEHRSVREDRGWAILKGQFQNAYHVAVQEWLAAREVIFLDSQPNRFVQVTAHGFQVEEAERVVRRTAADETMPAFEIAHSAADLEPKLVQMSQGHDGRRRVEDGQWNGHKSAFLVQVQFGFAGNKSENFSNLLKTVAKEEVGVSAITFGSENEE